MKLFSLFGLSRYSHSNQDDSFMSLDPSFVVQEYPLAKLLATIFWTATKQNTSTGRYANGFPEPPLKNDSNGLSGLVTRRITANNRSLTVNCPQCDISFRNALSSSKICYLRQFTSVVVATLPLRCAGRTSACPIAIP